MPKKETEAVKPKPEDADMPMKKKGLRPAGPVKTTDMRPTDKGMRPCDMPDKGMRKSPG